MNESANVNLGIIIYSNDSETVWNAFRLANFARTQNQAVRVFLLGRGVEADSIDTATFSVAAEMEEFIQAGGAILACGTCLKSRQKAESELCPVSTMADLYALVAKAEKVVTF